MPYYKSYPELIKEKKLKEFGHSSVSTGNPFSKSDEDPEDDDVPNVKDTKYKTFVPIPEQEEIPTTEPAMPPGAEGPPPEQMGMDPAMGADPAAMGADPAAMGMPPEEGPMSPQEVGRVFELKKIHARLVSIESYLATSTDTTLVTLRSYVAKALELFMVLVSNLKLFKDKIDDIIIVFYKFLDFTFKTLAKYYKDKDSGKDIKIS